MNARYSTLLTLLCLLLLPALVTAQGVTTANISGRILDTGNEPLIGATVVAVHEPTGTVYGNATDIDGYYRLANMRVGGPYTVTISYTGYGSQEFTGINLRLGESRTFDATLQDNTSELTEVVVTAQAGTAGQNAGASTQISTQEIEALPTLNRNINDFLRLTPQASSTGDGISFAGTNNRYNAIYIDGAVNNDVFGLASSGTNGGQTGASPFSIDIIDQFQVVLSPYDVSLGGFAGGGVNAVTKSGTNNFKGTAYYFYQDENLTGKTNGRLTDQIQGSTPTFERARLDPFKQQTYGASFGGPLVKDKVFFFVNAEGQTDASPSVFNYAQYQGAVEESQVEALRQQLISQYGYDPGSFGNVSDDLKSRKFFGKLDFNLSATQRLTLRHNYARAEQFDRNGSNAGTINFSNNGVYFPSTTNSSALELNSSFGTGASNNLIIGYTNVNDDRDPIGSDFPNVQIADGRQSIRFGSEAFSTANALKTNTVTLTDNFKLYRGKQTFTFGTHNEFYSFYNLFIRQNYGAYQYDSLAQFTSGARASRYDRTYSAVDEVTGDGSAAAAEFKALQLGFYAQDEIELTDRLTLTAGVRVDIPFFLTDPAISDTFNTSILPKLADQYPIADGVQGGKSPDTKLLWSPRVGFNYNFKNDAASQIRGGAGIFTSRIPFVWPGGQFTNNGITTGGVTLTGARAPVFNPDPFGQPINEVSRTQGGQVDLFTPDFKYPQVFRGNLAVDTRIPGGVVATVEGVFTKTINNIYATNINSDPTVASTLSGGPDNRNIYTGNRIDNRVGGDIYLISNTSKGYTYTITGSLAKKFGQNLDATLAYTYGDAYAINEGNSSQNSSIWRSQVNVNGRNNPVYGRSDYALGQRVVATGNYTARWNNSDAFATTISLFFNGQKGSPYFYVIGGRPAQNINNERGSTTINSSLIYVPQNQSDINLVDIKNSAGVVTLSADQQWANLNAFIESDSYLSERRGQYAEKNSNYLPFIGIFDAAIRQNVGFEAAGRLQRLQLSIDIFNLANLINKDWGTRYTVPGGFNQYQLYTLNRITNGVPEYNYTGTSTGKDALNISGAGSIWRARVGVRYLFN